MLENYSLDDGGDVELENKEITNYANKSMNESTSKLLTPIKQLYYIHTLKIIF